MKIPQGKVEMTRLALDMARDAIKISAMGNGGGATYVFTKEGVAISCFKYVAITFTMGFLFCVITAIFGYITQYKYNDALRIGLNEEVYFDKKLLKSGNRYRILALIFLWMSLVAMLGGVSFVAIG